MTDIYYTIRNPPRNVLFSILRGAQLLCMTLEHFNQLADEVADEIPQEFFRKLNGGIILQSRAKMHPASVPGAPLYIMGEYCRSYMMGRHIVIYFGSMNASFGHCSDEEMKAHIRSTLFHEFRHHLESLGGSRELEKVDAVRLAEYCRRHHINDPDQ